MTVTGFPVSTAAEDIDLSPALIPEDTGVPAGSSSYQLLMEEALASAGQPQADIAKIGAELPAARRNAGAFPQRPKEQSKSAVGAAEIVALGQAILIDHATITPAGPAMLIAASGDSTAPAGQGGGPVAQMTSDVSERICETRLSLMPAVGAPARRLEADTSELAFAARFPEDDGSAIEVTQPALPSDTTQTHPQQRVGAEPLGEPSVVLAQGTQLPDSQARPAPMVAPELRAEPMPSEHVSAAVPRPAEERPVETTTVAGPAAEPPRSRPSRTESGWLSERPINPTDTRPVSAARDASAALRTTEKKGYPAGEQTDAPPGSGSSTQRGERSTEVRPAPSSLQSAQESESEVAPESRPHKDQPALEPAIAAGDGTAPSRESGRSPSPPPTVERREATARPAEAPLETTAADRPQNAPPTVRQLSIRVSNGEDQHADIRVIDRAGDVRVGVRASDPELADSLRTGLSDLTAALDRRNIAGEVWRPAASSGGFEKSNSDSADSGKAFSGGDQNPAHRDGDSGGSSRRRPQEAPDWADDFQPIRRQFTNRRLV